MAQNIPEKVPDSDLFAPHYRLPVTTSSPFPPASFKECLVLHTQVLDNGVLFQDLQLSTFTFMQLCSGTVVCVCTLVGVSSLGPVHLYACVFNAVDVCACGLWSEAWPVGGNMRFGFKDSALIMHL